MGRSSFEAYGALAAQTDSHTVASGRYRNQAEAERLILPTIMERLAIAPQDHVLEIGCGSGTLSIPLSFLVEKITVIDHPEVLNRLKKRFSELETIEGNFLDLSITERYDKILCYSVIHTLANSDEAFAFIDKALTLLKPGGRFLIGDLANRDKKQRFIRTDFGKQFSQDWQKNMTAEVMEDTEKTQELFVDENELFAPDDAFIAEAITRYRIQGFDAYVLPQPASLPFGYTREDILIQKLPE